MLKEERRILEALKIELEFIDGVERQAPVQTVLGKQGSPFRDSPICPNWGSPNRPYPCDQCPLIGFVPARHRSDSVPCHHIPLNGRGETIEAIEARNQPEKLDGAVKYWLQSAIGWLERDRRSNKGLTALLVYDRSEPLDVLGPILENLGLSVIRARTCREARQVLESVTLPSLLFTEPSLPDGTWADIFDRTGVGRAAIAVIVVSQQVDLKLCMEVIDRGAYDCLVPPVAVFDLAHIVRCAARRPAST